MAEFNFVDLIIFIIFVSCILVGMARGLVKEIISLGSLVLAFIVASTFTHELAATLNNLPFIQQFVGEVSSNVGVNASQPVSYFTLALSFVCLFSATLIAGSIVGSILTMALQVGILGLSNRIFGGVFGFCRGFIINLVLIFLVQLTPIANQPIWANSKLVGEFQPAVAWLSTLISPALADIKKRFNKVMQDTGESYKQMLDTTINRQ